MTLPHVAFCEIDPEAMKEAMRGDERYIDSYIAGGLCEATEPTTMAAIRAWNELEKRLAIARRECWEKIISAKAPVETFSFQFTVVLVRYKEMPSKPEPFRAALSSTQVLSVEGLMNQAMQTPEEVPAQLPADSQPGQQSESENVSESPAPTRSESDPRGDVAP